MSTQVLQGDCLGVMPTLGTDSVDMLFADLPYGITANAWDSQIDLGAFWREARRIVKPNAAMVFTATMRFAATLIASNPGDFSHEWVWEKPHAVGHLNANRMPLRAHEHILVFGQGMPGYYPVMEDTPHLPDHKVKRQGKSGSNYGNRQIATTYSSNGQRYPRSVIGLPGVPRPRVQHPTQKPVALLSYLIRTYTLPGAVVLDPTMGSGTTGVACVETGRAFVGIELNSDYFALARQRIENAQIGMGI